MPWMLSITNWILFNNRLELINLITPRYTVENVEKDFYKLLIEEDTKPCLFLVVNLTSVEYYAMFASNLFSSTINNMVYILIIKYY